jgi:SAM-dependent methyltransferase
MSAQRMSLRDRFLARCVDDLRAHDRRIGQLDLEVRFDRGVAHLTGAVGRAEDLALARALIGRLDGVLAVWDRVWVDGREPVILDVGCGARKQYPANIGIDIRTTGAVSVVADASGGLPFASDSVDRVFLVHVLEHLIDFLPLVDDAHRVLRPDGVAYLLSPWWRYVNAVADPTHVRLLDVQTVKGICQRDGFGSRWYPLHAAHDEASIFAELAPLADNAPAPDDLQLARFFD